MLVGVRIPPDLLAKLDHFIADQETRARWKMDRPKAIRAVLEFALEELQQAFEEEDAAAAMRKKRRVGTHGKTKTPDRARA